MAIDPRNSKTLYASYGPVYKSTNGGRTWRAASEGLTLDFQSDLDYIEALAVDPGNPQIVYAGGQAAGKTSSRLFKSTNGGLSWQAASVGLEEHEVVTIAVDPRTLRSFMPAQATASPRARTGERLGMPRSSQRC